MNLVPYIVLFPELFTNLTRKTTQSYSCGQRETQRSKVQRYCAIPSLIIFYEVKYKLAGRKSGLVVSILDSRLEGRGFESHPILILNGNGVKAMPGSIP